MPTYKRNDQELITFIVQARTMSTRLPNKILLPFYKNKCILELLVEKLQQVKKSQIVIATSVEKSCDTIERMASKLDVGCFRGSEDDVLKRFIDTAEKFNAHKIIRVCSDNPFLELKSIHRLVEIANSQNDFDYISFNINGLPSIKTHYGFWTEYVTLDALKRVNKLTDEPLYHEHVTNFIYANEDLFRIKWINGPEVLSTHPYIRLTIDTEDDFKNVQRIYFDLYQKNHFPTIDHVVEYLDEHCEYYQFMKTQIVNNSK